MNNKDKTIENIIWKAKEWWVYFNKITKIKVVFTISPELAKKIFIQPFYQFGIWSYGIIPVNENLSIKEEILNIIYGLIIKYSANEGNINMK